MTLYTPKAVSDMVGASPSALRNYSAMYATWLSVEATQKPRKFTENDVRLIKFIVTSTKDQAMKHSEVQAALDGGALSDFDWWPPVQEETPGIQGTEDMTATALMLRSDLQTARVQLESTQDVLDEYRQREEAAQTRIVELERELGKAQGALDESRRNQDQARLNQRQAPQWWRTLFGGRE